MDGKAIHRCLHVLDLEKSIAFYEKALGMPEVEAPRRPFDEALLGKVHWETF